MSRTDAFHLYIGNTVVDVAFVTDQAGFPAQPAQLLLLGSMMRSIATLANAGQEPRADGKDSGISDCEIRDACKVIILLSTLSDAIASRLHGLDNCGRQLEGGDA